MGLFDRWRSAPPEAWAPPVLGSCSCEKHVESLRDTAIPYAQHAGQPSGRSVGALLDADALVVRLATVAETEVRLPTGQLTGPYHWVLETGPDVALLHDADAPVQLDDCLSVQAGVERVAVVDGGLALGAPGLCPSGVQAALVEALLNPRVRRSA